jgi:hypothetical protein
MTKSKEAKVKRIKMVDYDQITEKTVYPQKVFDQKSQKTVEVKQVVERMKRYNKNVTYVLSASIADKLLGRKTAVMV